MWANYEKNIYLPNEIAKAMVHVDNTRCLLNCNRVRFFVEQVLTISGCGLFGAGFGAHAHTYKNILTERYVVGPPAGQAW